MLKLPSPLRRLYQPMVIWTQLYDVPGTSLYHQHFELRVLAEATCDSRPSRSRYQAQSVPCSK